MMMRLDAIGENRLGGKVAVLIRHGERYAIPPNSYGTDVLLTPYGVSTALEFGRKRKHLPVRHVYASPIGRCVQTARSIVQGGDFDVEVSVEDNLGNPGFHISDAGLAGEHFLRYGAVGVFERFIVGEKIPGITEASLLRGPALQWIEEKCESDGVSIFVTHDSLIAHFAYANSICRYTRDSWVGYLDGLAIEFS